MKTREVNNKFKTLQLALSMPIKNGTSMEFRVFKRKTLKMIWNNFPSRTFGFNSFRELSEYWHEGFPQVTFQLFELPEVENNMIIPRLVKETLES